MLTSDMKRIHQTFRTEFLPVMIEGFTQTVGIKHNTGTVVDSQTNGIKFSIFIRQQGWPYMEEMEQNIYYYRNIYSDVSGYMRSIHRLNEIFDRQTHEGTGRYFNEKMFFATDEFYGEAASNFRALRLTQVWQNYFEFVGELYYRWGTPPEKEKFFRGNAITLRQSFPNS